MTRSSYRAAAVAMAISVVLVSGMAPAAGKAGSASGTREAAGVSVSSDTAGTQLWARRYMGTPGYPDAATGLAVSPNGSTVFVTGFSEGPTTSYDYATVAYRASTGAQLWASRYSSGSEAIAIGVSPDGSEVFVTGDSTGSNGSPDYATVAYEASTGARLWVRRYNGPKDSSDFPTALAVSPNGSAVFVTGDGTVAYDAFTGATLWVKPYNAACIDRDVGEALGVSPDGSEVFVTGYISGYYLDSDFVTVAYRTSDGAQLWAGRYNGRANSDEAYALGVSPDGSEVFVTGDTTASNGYPDYATVAFDASTGTKVWARRYNGPANEGDIPSALGVSPDGSAVFVTGSSTGTGSSGTGFATLAYWASTGATVWVKRYDRGDVANALGVSPDGSTVFVSGSGWESTGAGLEYKTVAYRADEGARLWIGSYDGPQPATSSYDFDVVNAIGVSPDGSKVFVTGDSFRALDRSQDDDDYATVAFSAT